MSQQVVVAYDFSDTADVALERAVEIACRAPAHVLHFVAVIDPHRGFGLDPGQSVDYRYAERVQRDLLGRLHDIFRARVGEREREIHFFVHALIGSPVEEILGVAEDVGADLVVLGSHGRTGMRRLLLGSTSEAVMRRAKCAVLVARPKDYEEVELSEVVEVPHPEGLHRRRPHRYSYSSSAIQSRPAEWPLN